MGDRIKLLACAAAAAFANAAPAWAQDAPPAAPAPAASSDATNQDEEIVVRADGDQVRIDRRVYAIRNDPIAQSTDMFDVLGRIPSISVDPSGNFSLLGSPGVEIQINGQPLPQGVTPEQALRGLQGADVERIEVITNPSAQYASDTAHGIINIITRQRFDRGFSGNANVSGDSFGGTQASFAPSWSHGRVTLGGRIGYYGGHGENDSDIRHTDLLGGASTNDHGRSDSDFHGLGANLQATYQFDPKDKGTLSFDSYSGGGDNDQITDRTGALGPIFRQDQDNDSHYSFDRVRLQLQHNGDKPGEQLRFDANHSSNPNSNSNIIAVDPADGSAASAFLSRNTAAFENTKATLDYDLPLGERTVLTLGLLTRMRSQRLDTLQRTLFGAPGVADDESSLFAREQMLAAYGTYQFGLGDWLLQPGLRIEDYRREITSAGAATDATDVRAFPTLHLRRSFTHIDVDLSYTSRIDRPDMSLLNPAPRFNDATHASVGNPNLRPSTVDAYEASLTYQEHEQTFGFTFFDRLEHSITSQTFAQIGDVTYATWVNAGDRENRGLEAILRGKFGPRWFYSFSASALSSAIDTLHNGALKRDDSFQYSGNASIEYRDRNQTVVGANDVQLELQFSGPQQTLQQETDAFYSVDFSWRRRLTDHVFGFLQVSDVFASEDWKTTIRTDDFIEREVDRSSGARIRLSLTYQFGAAPDQAPPPPSEGGSGGGPQ